MYITIPKFRRQPKQQLDSRNTCQGFTVLSVSFLNNRSEYVVLQNFYIRRNFISLQNSNCIKIYAHRINPDVTVVFTFYTTNEK